VRDKKDKNHSSTQHGLLLEKLSTVKCELNLTNRDKRRKYSDANILWLSAWTLSRHTAQLSWKKRLRGIL